MQVNYIKSDEDLTLAYQALGEQCPLMKGLIDALPRPGLRLEEGGFFGLCRIVVFQQISISAGNAIWGRFSTVPQEITPQGLLACNEADLKAAGLSAGKIRTILGLAKALIANEVDLKNAESLLSVKGIGPWTVEIYRLSCMGDADVWPAGDIALQQALGDLLGFEIRPSAKETIPLVAKWQPYRAVAARLLWGLYRKNKSMMPV